MEHWSKYFIVGKKAHRTEIQGDAVAQVVIVPGNPGSALLYLPFLKLLFEAHRGKVDVMVISHLGHDLKSSHGDQLFSLEEQIQHKVDTFRDVILQKGRPPTVILAHSIGGFMTLHAMPQLLEMARATSTEIVKVIGLFPFLEADFTLPRVRMINLLGRYHWYVGLLAGFMSVLPQCIKAGFFHTFSKDKLNAHAVRTCCALLTRNNLRQFFYLASCYVVKNPFNWNLMTNLGDLLIAFACPNDTWMPKALFDFIQSSFPDICFRWEERMAHAFIVSDERCQIAADIVAAIVESLIQL